MTKLEEEMKGYAQSYRVQKLLQELLTDVFINKPEEPVAYIIQWLSNGGSGEAVEAEVPAPVEEVAEPEPAPAEPEAADAEPEAPA